MITCARASTRRVTAIKCRPRTRYCRIITTSAVSAMIIHYNDNNNNSSSFSKKKRIVIKKNYLQKIRNEMCLNDARRTNRSGNPKLINPTRRIVFIRHDLCARGIAVSGDLHAHFLYGSQ